MSTSSPRVQCSDRRAVAAAPLGFFEEDFPPVRLKPDATTESTPERFETAVNDGELGVLGR
jgi:hypothetical protein